MASTAFQQIRDSLLAELDPIAATDAPKGKGGKTSVDAAAPIQDIAMLNVAEMPPQGNADDAGPGLFSGTNTAETRRMRAWLADRIRRGQTEVFSEVISLTPVLAELLLENNPDNRNLRHKKVETFATDIRNGDWPLNGETLKLSKEGLLNDGQHRCHAVISAGRPIPTIITFGVARETRMTVDQGAVRTAGNYLAMAGYECSNQMSAVSSMLWQMETLGRLSKHEKPTKVQISQVANAHPGISDSIRAVPSNARVGRSRSVLAFCHYLISRRAKLHADSFFLRLVLGDGLSRNDPIYHCRERLIGGQRITQEEKVEIILRTWNAHRKGQRQTKCSPIMGTLPAIEK